MKSRAFYWRIWPGIVGLILVLSACGSGSTTGTTTGGSGTPGQTGTSAPAGNTPVPTQSSVTFTASGGLSGTYTIKDTDRGSNYGKALTILISDQNWYLTLSYSAYTGPGNYTLRFNQAQPPWGDIVLASHDGKQRWALMPTTAATCQMTISSDVTLNSGGSGPTYHEVKGSFSCPSLPAATSSGASVSISNGQFDIVALAFTAS